MIENLKILTVIKTKENLNQKYVSPMKVGRKNNIYYDFLKAKI